MNSAATPAARWIALALLCVPVACSLPPGEHADDGSAAAEADGAAAGLAEASSQASELSEEEAAALETVLNLFRAMRTSDGELARSAFHPEARMGRRTENGITFGPADGFIEAIGRPKEEVWDEPIFNVVVNVDGELAQAWTPYAFFLGDEYSHCGTDAFELYREGGEWRITQLVDTRRDECDMPDEALWLR